MSEQKNFIKILKKDGIGIIPTDTVYALVGSAFSKKVVERIYKVRKREGSKPFIVLISTVNDLKRFNVLLSAKHLNFLNKIWPGSFSVILPPKSNKFLYLHRGTGNIAFRLPKDKWLRTLLKKTGPLVAPSANISGKPPAKTIAEAKKYFGNKVDFYLDGGKISKEPSTLIEIKR